MKHVKTTPQIVENHILTIKAYYFEEKREQIGLKELQKFNKGKLQTVYISSTKFDILKGKGKNDIFNPETDKWERELIDIKTPKKVFQAIERKDGKEYKNEPVLIPVYETTIINKKVVVSKVELKTRNASDLFAIFTQSEFLKEYILDSIVDDLSSAKVKREKQNEYAKLYGEPNPNLTTNGAPLAKPVYFSISVNNEIVFDTDTSFQISHSKNGKLRIGQKSSAELKGFLRENIESTLSPFITLNEATNQLLIKQPEDRSIIELPKLV